MRFSSKLFVIFGFTLILSDVGQSQDDEMIIEAGDLGRIRGSNTSTVAEQDGIRKPYITFTGMRYASFSQRFAPSEMVEGPLNATGDVYDATMNGLQCFQPAQFFIPSFYSEDCLSINVYTPKKYTGDDSALLPVIVFIHGGAFTVGSGAMFSPFRILNRDVVYVSFNYRLGLAGFFTLNNDEAPGNAAMYDMVNALKWVNKYVKYFGGNPNLVTIAGQSAGSVAVTQLLVSPMARGLFHRAIGASGSALNAWGTSRDALQEHLHIATLTGCHNAADPVYNLTQIAGCMRSIHPKTLVDVLFNYQVSERQAARLGFSVVSPVVQNFDLSHPKFLPEDPETVFRQGTQADVPLMMGSTKQDGSYVLGVVYNRFLKDNGLENDTAFLRNELVSTFLEALDIEDKPAGIHNSLASAYLMDARLTGDFNQMFAGLIDLFSVFFFKGGCYQTALLHSKVNPSTYWYSFDYKGPSTLFGSLFWAGEQPPFPGGVTHTDDLIYVFLLTFLPLNNEELTVSSRVLDYWANFAASGNPTPTSSSLTNWPSLNENDQRYLVINTQSSSAEHYSDSWAGASLELLPPQSNATLPPSTTTTMTDITTLTTTATDITPTITTPTVSDPTSNPITSLTPVTTTPTTPTPVTVTSSTQSTEPTTGTTGAGTRVGGIFLQKSEIPAMILSFGLLIRCL